MNSSASTESGCGLMKWTLSKLNPRNMNNNSENSSPSSSIPGGSPFSKNKPMSNPQQFLPTGNPSMAAGSCGKGTQASSLSTSPSIRRVIHTKLSSYQDSSAMRPHSPVQRAREAVAARTRRIELPDSGEEACKLQEEITVLKTQVQNLNTDIMHTRRICDEKDEKLHAFESDMRSLKDNLDCPICATPFDRPHFLSCGHTICANCLQSWFISIKENQPRTALLHTNICPICRAITLIPAPAYLVKSMAERFNPRLSRLLASSSRGLRSPRNSDIVWEGFFEEELEFCQGCGGMARYGECLGYAGVYGRDTIVGYEVE